MVELAVVAKSLVVVAFVVVEFPVITKLPMFVEEADEMKPPVSVARPETEREERVPILVREERVVTPGMT